MLRTPDEAYRLAMQHSKEYVDKEMEGVPVDSAYVHTDNNYTTAEKNKLAAVKNVANLTYVTVSS